MFIFVLSTHPTCVVKYLVLFCLFYCLHYHHRYDHSLYFYILEGGASVCILCASRCVRASAYVCMRVCAYACCDTHALADRGWEIWCPSWCRSVVMGGASAAAGHEATRNLRADHQHLVPCGAPHPAWHAGHQLLCSHQDCCESADRGFAPRGTVSPSPRCLIPHETG